MTAQTYIARREHMNGYSEIPDLKTLEEAKRIALLDLAAAEGLVHIAVLDNTRRTVAEFSIKRGKWI